MGADLLTFLQRCELLGFFAGFPVLFAIIYVASSWMQGIPTLRWEKSKALLPASYALVGTLFLLSLIWPVLLGQPLRAGSLSITALRAWGLLAMLFWIPRLRRLPFCALLHSLVFFALIAVDILTGHSTASGRDQIRNDMSLLTDSMLLHAVTFAIVLLAFRLRQARRKI
jgi:hypothetical protein